MPETLDVANDFPETLQEMVREFNAFKEEVDRMHKQLPAQGVVQNRSVMQEKLYET